MNFTRTIFWHRSDLRIKDNLGLIAACEKSKALTGVYIIDPDIFNNKKISISKKWFIFESLKELESNWKKSGSELLILKGKPIEILPILCRAINAKIVVWNKEVDPDQIKKDSQLNEILSIDNIKTIECWDHLLLEPGSIRTKSDTFYKVYTPFLLSWKEIFNNNFSNGVKINSNPKNLIKTNKKELNQSNYNFLKKLNFVKNLEKLKVNFDGYSLCPCMPGEIGSEVQLKKFCKSSLMNSNKESIYYYEENRDFPSIEGTSLLSAALAIGTISPRLIINSIQNSRLFAFRSNNHDALKSISIWEKEIIWREFYHHSLFAYPELKIGPFKSKWQYFPWQNDSNKLNSWINGLTGFPIVDAAMRQLNSSGWMHNRCRMIVASFLVKDLICDWRLGESNFMQKLVDGDIASNNGGWQWSASSGMDSKPLRIFNPYTQANKFDKKAIYIKKWLPELAHINNRDLVTGDILPIERRGYPEPIVNHNFQQSLFRGIYAQL